MGSAKAKTRNMKGSIHREERVPRKHPIRARAREWGSLLESSRSSLSLAHIHSHTHTCACRKPGASPRDVRKRVYSRFTLVPFSPSRHPPLRSYDLTFDLFSSNKFRAVSTILCAERSVLAAVIALLTLHVAILEDAGASYGCD